MDPETADIIIRSRHTLLDILDDRGYDTTAYRHIANEQILTLARGAPAALNMIVPRKATPGSSEGGVAEVVAPCERAVVSYQLFTSIRLRMATFVRDIFEIAPDASETSTIKRTDDIIVVLNEPYHEIFDKTALQMWQLHKTRMVFFHIKQLVVHPGRHVLVPPHKKLTADETVAVLERLHVINKSQLPLIKHHDIQARVLGLVPGDIVRILRPSPTSGVAEVLRICAA
jgi:DNA-directed RNA polymerase subunit H